MNIDALYNALDSAITDGDNIAAWREPFDFHTANTIWAVQHKTFKPEGLWYACGLDWIRFLYHEWPDRFAKTKYFYKLHIDKTNILQIHTEIQLRNFAKTFVLTRKAEFHVVDWPAVADEYDGIEICPFQWKLSREHKFTWYSGWDVASGCIWNSDCILSVDELQLE